MVVGGGGCDSSWWWWVVVVVVVVVVVGAGGSGGGSGGGGDDVLCHVLAILSRRITVVVSQGEIEVVVTGMVLIMSAILLSDDCRHKSTVSVRNHHAAYS
jgi:hypothetical protein